MQEMSPRRAFAGSLTAALLALIATPSGAQPAYPSKAIRILVGAPPGGSNDIFARSIGQQLSTAVKQPVIVDNRPGASQMIAADLMVKAPPDGYTLYVSSTTYTTAAAIQPKLPFDPLADVTGVTLIAKSPMVLVVHPSVPAKSAKELIALASAQPGQLNYTSSGIGSINHMATELFNSAAKIKMVHVPHKGMSPAITDLMAGNVQVLLVSLPSVDAQMKSGRLRAIGTSTAKRAASAPEVTGHRRDRIARLRRFAVVGLVRFSQDSESGGRPLERRGPQDARDRRDEEAVRCLRRRGRADDAGGLQRHDQERDRELAQGGEAGGHQARVTPGEDPRNFWNGNCMTRRYR